MNLNQALRSRGAKLPTARGSYLPAGNGMALADAGAVTNYRPAIHRKPEKLIERFTKSIASMRGKELPAAMTTQQGSSAVSPVTYPQTLWPQRFEKAEYIADCNNQWFMDPACNKACNMFVSEAVRGGVRLRIEGSGQFEQKVQALADDYVKLWPVNGGPKDGVSLFGAGTKAMTDGEFWPMVALSGTPGNATIDHFLTLPAAGMERNTDDADQFIDTDIAYTQVDTQTWNEVANFPLWQVFCARWNWIPGSKNGNPEILPVRKLARYIQLMETCKITQVQVRSSIRYLYSYGTPENPASPDEVRDLMALNGFVEGKRDIFDSTEVARDIHMGGIGGVEVLEGDQNLGTVDHLRYFLDRYTNGLPTPRQLMSLGAENINRDTLKDIKGQWLKDTTRVTQFIDGPVKYFFELQCLLKGIDPDDFKYSTLWTTSSASTSEEQIESHTLMFEGGVASLKTTVTNLQQFTGVVDVDKEIRLIQQEQKERDNQELEKRKAGMTVKDQVGDETGKPKLNGKPKLPSFANKN